VGNALFSESKYLFEDAVDLLNTNLRAYVQRNQPNNILLRQQIDTAYQQWMTTARANEVSQYAMTANLIISDRMRKYNTQGAGEIKDGVAQAYMSRAIMESTTAALSIITAQALFSQLEAIIINLFIIVILFVLVLAFILNQSLVLSVSFFLSLIRVGRRRKDL
jgi:hypothetical protein